MNTSDVPYDSFLMKLSLSSKNLKTHEHRRECSISPLSNLYTEQVAPKPVSAVDWICYWD